MSDADLPDLAGWTRQHAQAMDAADPLAPVRDRFELPPGLIYLDGNSLGPLPRAARQRLLDAVDNGWARGLVSSWNNRGWIDLALRVGDRIGQLMGAASGQVLVADSTSINVFKLVASVLDQSSCRPVVLSERGIFPTDLYMTKSVLDWARHTDKKLRLVERHEVFDHIDRDTALVLLSHVDFRSGHLLDMRAVTERAHECGALVLWDLCHSTGALPVDLDACDVDLAVGCTYKFLNAGPGAPAYIYVAQRLQERLRQPLAGWFGHARPFAFEPKFAPASHLAKFQCGTPPVLALETLAGALSVWDDIRLDDVRQKSVAQTERLINAFEATRERHGLVLASPRDPSARGSQVSLQHVDGYAIARALGHCGVVGDFRAPDLIRLGITPLYTRYVDVWDAAARTISVIETRQFDQPQYRERQRVT